MSGGDVQRWSSFSWMTYSPDGREVEIERDEQRWLVLTSDGGRGEATALDDALSQALGHPRERSLTGEKTRAEAEWIRNQAERVEREFRRMASDA